ncbi:AraC family transcriptional regulator [Streptomyces rubiginosohelvolus]|uniref:helix-turn-helix transcriptional regulator n=1 Tax=Streptomyces rubiginosohelvolus TaxID=67362 RepID=UPI0036DB005B
MTSRTSTEQPRHAPLLPSRDPFDCTVGDIDYVLNRQTTPGWRITRHVNTQSHIMAFAVSGRADYEIAGQAYRIRPGALILMPRGTEHTASSDQADPWHFMSVAFRVTAADQDPDILLDALPAVSSDLSVGVASAFAQLHTSWTSREPGSLLQMRSLTSSVLFQVIQRHCQATLEAPHTRRISVVTQLLTDNYSTTYTVRQLAALSGFSPSHFRTVFKRVTGMSATAYQQHIKIAKATEYLRSGEFNVTETARLTGFRDVHYFSRLYKQMTGTNPSQLFQGGFTV